MKHAAPWFTSGTFWTIVGVAVALIGIPITNWVTLRAGYPRRRLYYGLPVVTPMLNAEDDMREGIEVRRGGRVLTEPHVVEIKLISQSRLDIANHHFNAGRPLRLDVGAPIVEILKVSTQPSNREIPKVEVVGTGIEIGPALIGKRQEVSFFLLVDGPKPRLTCPHPAAH
ncbi:hypothetical protein [Actinoallomurus sp. NPDC052274]|uniref:hypothetical protein n=1 Tax=Actinoallomurus sp. NPDC052274 TaxID=3155420 RepID=UPI0034335372